ncbi:MAG: hypothetical protein QOE73_1860 [Verrucomicrobiota bacterium]
MVESTDAARRVYQSAPTNKFMKPTPQIDPDYHLRRDGQVTDHRSFPATDYGFQSSVETLGCSTAVATQGMAELRTFRKVSRDFFRAEATRDYVTEALLFVLMSCAAAWPMGVTIHQLTRWTI